MIDALPAIETSPVTNAVGATHRHSAFIACRWPLDGGLTTRERTAWNGRPTGTGPAWPPPTQPDDAGRAFLRLIEQTSSARDARPWRIGIAEHCEWYTISAALSAPFELGGLRVERWASLEHATHWNQVTCRSGILHRLTGAAICAHATPAAVEHGRLADLAGGVGAEAFARRLAEDALEIERSVKAWSGMIPAADTLRSWADAYVKPGWGRAAADDAAAPGREAGEVSAATAVWRLARACLAIQNVEERLFKTEHAVDIVDELASAETAEPAASVHRTVH